MTHEELKTAAAAKIVVIDAALTTMDVPTINKPANILPADDRVEQMLLAVDKVLQRQPLRKPQVRRLTRIRELFSRFVA